MQPMKPSSTCRHSSAARCSDLTVRHEPTAPPELVSSLRRRLAEEGSFSLRVRVRPGKRETRVAGDALADADLILDIAAPPIDDRANKEMVRFVAELFGITSADVTVLHGWRGPRKVVRIR